MTLCDFGKKVLDFFVSNSEEEETILFVLDDDSYSRLFENNDDKNDFEIRIKRYIEANGLSFNNDNIAVALAAHQVLLAYEKIKSFFENDTDRAINEAIAKFYNFNANQIYTSYYHKYTTNDNKKLWENVSKVFLEHSRRINLPTTGFEYVKYPNEQIKFYRTFKNDEFNSLFSNWMNSAITSVNQIYTDTYCGDLIFKYFSDSSIQTIIPILWTYYSLWKRNTKLSEDDKGLYIELYDDKHIFKIAGDVFNRKRNHINPTERRLYKVFEHESGYWWRAAKDEIPSTGEFVLLVDKNFEDKFSTTNPIRFSYVDDECDFIVYKYRNRPDNFQTDFPHVPMLIGGVRLHNNQYLDIPWLLPQNKDGLNYAKVAPVHNIDGSLQSVLDNIDGLNISAIDDSSVISNIEVQSASFEETLINLSDVSDIKLSEQEEAIVKCQQALFLWLATKGKASHLSVHNICINLIENFKCLSNLENDYPEYFIFQPLFKAGIIELYKTEEGKKYYALSKGGQFSSGDKLSYRDYNNSESKSINNVNAFLNSLPSLENSFYKLKDLFNEQRIDLESPVFIRYSTKYYWSSGSYETKYSTIYKNPSIFKISNKVYSPTYFCDSNGRSFELKDDFANPWYPISWNICESYIDIKKNKSLFVYSKSDKRLLCKDFTALPIHFARALICINPEKLKDHTLWLSYFNPLYKKQVFNNVDEKLYQILKNKFLEKRDVESILIKTNKIYKTFSFKGLDYQLPTRESFRIFRFRVEEDFSCWQSDIDTYGIPENRPFGLLIDSAYGAGYVSHTNARIYESESCNEGRPMSFIVYSRLPDDFFDKLSHYKISLSNIQKSLLNIPNYKRNKVKSIRIDGLDPDIRNIDVNILDIIHKKFSFTIDTNTKLVSKDSNPNGIEFIFGNWINELDILPKLSEIEDVTTYPNSQHPNLFEINSFKVKDVKAVKTKVPLSSNKEKWEKLLNEGKNPWEYTGYSNALLKPKSLIGKIFSKPLSNIKYETVYDVEKKNENDKNFDSIYILQERLYKWLEQDIGYASLAEIHEFLMQQLETIQNFEFYGINPEEKILNPLLYSGIIDCRISEDGETPCYTLSKSRKILKINSADTYFDYQNHFAGGDSVILDSEDVLIYLMSLLNENISIIKRKLFDSIEFLYDKEKQVLLCSNICKIPWQIGRVLTMMDVSKIISKEIYLCCCKEYKAFSFGNVSAEFVYILDEVISQMKKDK